MQAVIFYYFSFQEKKFRTLNFIRHECIYTSLVTLKILRNFKENCVQELKKLCR